VTFYGMFSLAKKIPPCFTIFTVHSLDGYLKYRDNNWVHTSSKIPAGMADIIAPGEAAISIAKQD